MGEPRKAGAVDHMSKDCFATPKASVDTSATASTHEGAGESNAAIVIAVVAGRREFGSC